MMMHPDITMGQKRWLRLFAAVCCALLAIALPAEAQEGDLKKRVTMHVTQQPLSGVLSLIEQQTAYRFAYNSNLLVNQPRVSLNADQVTVPQLLDMLFRNTTLSYSIIGNQVVLQEAAPPQMVTLSGYVKDMQTGEFLIGASVVLEGGRAGAVSNNYGFYSLTVRAADTAGLTVSYIGYKREMRRVPLRSNQALSFGLALNEQAVKLVEVVEEKKNTITQKHIDATEVSSDMLTNMPSASGNGDVMSSVQMMPGVQAGMDGQSGYSVRGGNIDQNQVLLDEATIYNTSHLFGLVGIFNSSAVKKITMLKGGFPANYGGHLSSVLDVSMKEGNSRRFGGDLQLGTLVSSATFTGPLVPGKASYLISARRSMIDWVLRPIAERNDFSDYHFYDLNAKVNFQLSPKDKLYFSYYRGADKGDYAGEGDDGVAGNDGDDDDDDNPPGGAPGSDGDDIEYNIAFGNQTVNLRWNHIFSRKLFSNLSAVYGNYFQRTSATQEDYFAAMYSGIRDLNLKADMYYYPHHAHTIRGGVHYLYQTLFPATVSNRLSATGFIHIQQKNIPAKQNNQLAAYLSDDIRIGRALTLYAGVRVPVFFAEDAQYVKVEPRVSAIYRLGKTAGIKAAYANMNQYIHLVQSYNASFPAEVWIGSSRLVKPQFSHQVSAGVYKNFNRQMYQLSVDGYYKQMGNQLLFKGGTQPTIDSDIEKRLIFGEGWSYGMEVVLKKYKGKLTGWMSYSLSEAWQRFDSLNAGARFTFANNRRHSFYLSGSYDITPKWSVSCNVFIASGRSMTLKQPASVPGNPEDNPLFDDDDDDVGAPGGTGNEPNNFRLTPYDRLDLGIRYKRSRVTAKRVWRSEWTLFVYNVLAKRNTYFAYRSIDPVTKQAMVKQVSFIPVIPSLSYSLKF